MFCACNLKLLPHFRRLRRAVSIDTSSMFSTSIGDYDSVYSDDESLADDLHRPEDLLSSTEPGGLLSLRPSAYQ